MSTSPEELLLNVAYTTEDAHSVLELLKEFLESYFFSEHALTSREKILEAFIKDKKVTKGGAAMLNSLPAAFWEAVTRENMYEKIDSFAKTFDSLPRIVLYVPKKLPYDEIKKVGQWMHSNVEKNLLMDIRVDAKAIGGCKLAWKGVYHDFSLRYFIKKHKRELVSMIREHGDR